MRRGKYLILIRRRDVELLTTDNEIDIFHAMQVSNVAEFPVEDFF